MSDLHDAVKEGDLERVKSLLDAGMDVDELNDEGATALHLACCSGNSDAIRELLQSGADAEIDSEDWELPLNIAVSNGHLDIAMALVEHIIEIPIDYGRMLIGFAAASGSIETLEYTIEAFGPVTLDTPHFSPLHWAAQENHQEIIDYLIRHGLDVNTVDEMGRTPLFACLSNEATDAMQVLLKNGANPNFRAGETKDNCLQLAAAFNQCAIAELLLDNGAEVDIVDNKDRTPLMSAVNHGNIEMVRLLMDRGADVNLKNYKGKTAKELAKTKAMRELFEEY